MTAEPRCWGGGGGVSHPSQLTTGLVIKSVTTSPTLAGERMLFILQVSILSEQVTFSKRSVNTKEPEKYLSYKINPSAMSTSAPILPVSRMAISAVDKIKVFRMSLSKISKPPSYQGCGVGRYKVRL